MPRHTDYYTSNLLKPIRSRVDYNFFNYCATCGLKLSKQILRCPECNQKVRTKPWHRSKLIQVKRI
jgi:DNA-directed RNA polymerase subunit RPC12/RpoP